MSKISDEFYIQVPFDEAKLVCKNVIAQLGWRVMEDNSNKIVCKEVAIQWTSFNYPAEIAISLSDYKEKTKIVLDGSIFGFGPIQSGHLQGQIGRIKNLIETCSTQSSNQNVTQNKTENLSNELEKLAELHSKGILSDEEFKSAKNKLLNM